MRKCSGDPGDVRQQPIATSMAYIHFLVDHPTSAPSL